MLKKQKRSVTKMRYYSPVQCVPADLRVQIVPSTSGHAPLIQHISIHLLHLSVDWITADFLLWGDRDDWIFIHEILLKDREEQPAVSCVNSRSTDSLLTVVAADTSHTYSLWWWNVLLHLCRHSTLSRDVEIYIIALGWHEIRSIAANPNRA